MLFDDKKLHLESSEDLIQSPIHTVEAFSLMLAPTYIFMKLNQKFVSVKAPLDFFTVEELVRLKGNEVFYFPKFINSSVSFQTAAILIKNILTIQQLGLCAAPYEISKEIFIVLSDLWGNKIQIEPFFMAIFADQVCESLNQDKMLWARENTVINHDHGLLLSGTFVFIALHLGWLDMNVLNQFRKTIYERTVQGESWENPKTEMESLVCDLNKILKSNSSIQIQNLKDISKEWSNKLVARLILLKQNKSISKIASATIYGEEGFAA